VTVNVDLALLLAVVLLVATVLLIIWRHTSYWRARLASGNPVNDCGSFEDFYRATPQLHDNDKTAEPAIYLTERVTKLYDEANDATKNIETKATTILGFVGGGASIFALSMGSSGTARMSVTPLVVAALLYFVGALVACLVCLVGRKRRGIPELRREFGSADVLNDSRTTKSRVAAYMFLALLSRFYDFIKINAKKSYAIEVAQQLFAFGVLAIVMNYLVLALVPPTPVRPAQLHCSASGKTLAVSTKLDCTVEAPANK
jgi:hypothetical protein